MSKRRVRTTSGHEADDVFIAKVLELGKWAEKNQQLLAVGVVVLAIAVFGIVTWGNSREAMNEAAAQELVIAHRSIDFGDVEGAKSELITFLDRFAGSAYEGEARLLLGQLYLETDDAQQAMAVLEPLGASPSEPIELQAATLLAVSYEQEGRLDEAEELYLRIADRSDLDFQVRDALVSAARLRGARGDAVGAIDLYERAMEDLDENGPEWSALEMRIAELRAAGTTS